MKKLRKIIIAFVVIFISYLFNNFSYAVTQERAGQGLANFANNFFENYAQDTVYSVEDREVTYTGLTTDGKYKFDCVGWISFAIHQSLHIGSNEEFTKFAVPPGGSNYGVGFQNGFQLMGGNADNANTVFLKQGDDISFLKPGDLLFCGPNGPHVVLYVGNGQITHSIGGGLKRENLFNNSSGYQYYCAYGRITQQTANSIQEGNITEVFDGEYEDEYGRYYGTTEGRYVGSYNIVSWLFSKFVGFMDYLFGIIAYILRAPFVGWANIIENMINDTLVSIQGVQVHERQVIDSSNNERMAIEVTEAPSTIEDRDTNSLYKPVANDKLGQNTVDSSDRINIEDIIYNNVPILDVDIFDVNLDRFVNAGKFSADDAKKSSVVLLRKNVAIWYYSIRNVTIVAMLIVLIYLGIRLAIATVGEKKAQYKELIKAWIIGFCAMFLIQFFMIVVLEVNNVLVDIFKNALDGQLVGSQSMYDTIRTRAYSFKLSEGVPATIIYMVLIYFLIRFLFVYIKRYFTINILALIGPIIGVKYAYDKIQKGKTTSLSNWMFDFAMNVLLQTVHAMLYSVFMLMAFEISTTSIPGFVLALCILNFIFKAEDLFLKIFKFDDRASSIKDVRENKNYFAEAYKVTTGIAYFSKAIPEYGWGLVKGTASYVGDTVGLIGQTVTTGVNVTSWAIRNRNTTIKDLKEGKGKPYKHVDFKKSVKGIADKVGASVTGKLDDAVYAISGVRSLKLGLGRMKLKDPERYKATKSLLERTKKQKKQVLKRNLGNGIKSVSTMAKLIASVPMLVVNPGSGFTMLTTTVGDLKDMAKGEPYYGHMSRKQIRSRRGRVAATLLFGTPVIAVNGASKELKQLEKDRKNIRKNEEILGNLRQAEVLKSTILQQTALISALRQLELQDLEDEEKEKASKQYDKTLETAIKNALDSVLKGRDIEAAIKAYMIKNKITKLHASDIEKLLVEFNLGNIEKQILSLVGAEQRKIDELQAKLNELKEKLNGAASGVALSEEEKKNTEKEIKSKEAEISTLTNKISIIKEVGKEASKCQGLGDYMVHKYELQQVVNHYIEKKKNQKITKKDIDKIVQEFQQHVQATENSYTTKDRIIKEFAGKKGLDSKKKLDRKKTAGVILESFIEKPQKGQSKEEAKKGGTEEQKEQNNSNSSKTEQQMKENMFADLTEMIKELRVLEQKNDVMYGNHGVQVMKFKKEIKFGEQKKKSKKKKK